MVDKRGALILVIITTIGAPLGVWLLQFASTDLVWWLYVGVLLFLAARMILPKPASTEVVREITDASRAKAAGAAAPAFASHLADLRARSGLTTEQLIYAGRAAGWLEVPRLEPR